MNCCNVCRKFYSTKQNLKRHQKTTKIHKKKSIISIQSFFRKINVKTEKNSTNILVLFSGTNSIEKVCEGLHSQCEIRGLDIVNTHKPYYNVDILTWDYKTEFDTWIPDFIHGSPVCKEFSRLKKDVNRDMELGMSLLEKCIEIIQYVKNLNPNLKFTIENPKGKMRNLEIMEQFDRITTSYCKYGFPYQKDTDFWYGGFDLVLKPQCSKKCPCVNRKNLGYHTVRIGMSSKSKLYTPTGTLQIGDSEYLKILRKDYGNEIKNSTFLRYRIPSMLCSDILYCVQHF